MNKKDIVLTVEKTNGEIIEIPCENPFILKTKLMKINKTVTTESLESAIKSLTVEIAKLSKGLRPELKNFAKAMETKLKKNDYKSSWKDSTVIYLLKRLLDEIYELTHAFNSNGDMAIEAVDVANFAMMIYNKVKNVGGDKNNRGKKTSKGILISVEDFIKKIKEV